MRLCVISFTEKGMLLSEEIGAMLEEMDIALFTKHRVSPGKPDRGRLPIVYVETGIEEWAKERLQERCPMLFIGACGIAVRAAAPWLTDKLHDSPVLVMDEQGRYVIPILSGHMGGANELAVLLAKKTGANPVITTATDINGTFSVDLFAKRNALFIMNKDGIAKVSAKLLDGKEITLSVETGHMGKAGSVPEGIHIVDYPPQDTVDVLISSDKGLKDAALWLRPKEYVVGIGCKRGKKEEEIREIIIKKQMELGISVSQVYALASIDQKRDEQGINAWCQKEGIPFLTYTAKKLQKEQGNFSKSAFVKEKVGIDNVCERAAVKGCGSGGKLIAGKHAENGMTIAVAKRKWSVDFDEEDYLYCGNGSGKRRDDDTGGA